MHPLLITGGFGGIAVGFLIAAGKYTYRAGIGKEPVTVINQVELAMAPVAIPIVAHNKSSPVNALPLVEYERMIYRTIPAGMDRESYMEALKRETAVQVKYYRVLKQEVHDLFTPTALAAQTSREARLEPKQKRTDLKKLKNVIAAAKQRIAMLNGNGQYRHL